MITNSIIKNILTDIISLRVYLNGEAPLYEDVKRRLLLLLRAEDKNVPDHYYRLNQDFFLEGIDSISQLLTKGLYNLAEEHLEMINGRIYVKQEMQSSWQELITNIPPLILQMAFLYEKKPICSNAEITELREYCQKYILPNVRYTALPHPYIPEIEFLVDKQNGLHDLHIHLNGSTETDLVWQDLMLCPQNVVQLYNDCIKNNTLAEEQVEQDFAPMDAMSLESLLFTARRIRQYLFEVLFHTGTSNNSASNKETSDNVESNDGISTENNSRKYLNVNKVEELIKILVNDNDDIYDGVENPFVSLITGDATQWKTTLNVEGLMYVLVFGHMVESQKDGIAAIFHFYLLILGLFNRMLVQQKRDIGFEEFQKYTQNGIRDNSENLDYHTRFLQLCGNDAKNVAFVEGRFSPKSSCEENQILISNIIKGWDNSWREMRRNPTVWHKRKPKLKLIAHFIKKKEGIPTLIRHEKLRKDVWERAYTLGLMKNDFSPEAGYIVGIDAAASEFDAPPEVFAPSFRYLKRKGFRHFTYHAGEDFYHLIGGLRSIYEAVTFLDMSYGDRIGHATAAGLSPELWVRNVGECIYMHRGEYLDDIVFAYNLIARSTNDELKHKIIGLTIKIQELFYCIYGFHSSIEQIIEAWKQRRLCPLHIFAGSKNDACYLSLYDQDEWCDISNTLHLISDKTCQCGTQVDEEDEVLKLLRLYHCPKCRKKYEEIIKVKTDELFNIAELEQLQLLVLEYLHSKEIVIETLPTSNVRIGHHHTYDTYHLWNWVKWENEGKPIPPIVVGTDDAGIFATDIYNEYANVYCNLVYTHKISRIQALAVIEKLDKNSQIYRFM